MPEPGREETVRVVALDKNFHMKCYKCEVGHPSGPQRWEVVGHRSLPGGGRYQPGGVWSCSFEGGGGDTCACSTQMPPSLCKLGGRAFCGVLGLWINQEKE